MYTIFSREKEERKKRKEEGRKKGRKEEKEREGGRESFLCKERVFERTWLVKGMYMNRCYTVWYR